MSVELKNEMYLLALQVRTAGIQLQELKAAEFPRGCLVYVRAPRYTGYGIASIEDGCPPDQLPVRLENENVWWYPVECCSRVRDFKPVPHWIRRLKMKMAGMKAINFWPSIKPALP